MDRNMSIFIADINGKHLKKFPTIIKPVHVEMFII